MYNVINFFLKYIFDKWIRGPRDLGNNRIFVFTLIMNIAYFIH